MSDENELLFDELYEKTKDCGRVQFINLLMTKERENKELKLELSGYRQAILDNKEMLGLKEQNDKLKKQLEKVLNDYCRLDAYNRTQQKDFIKWLESMLDNDRDIFSVVRVKDVLLKFKEIIGVSDENRTTL